MELFLPHSGQDPRGMAEQDLELWTPTLVGRKTLVSNLGRLFQEGRGVWLPKANKMTGYRQLYLRGHGKAYVHWLVISSFEGVLGRRVYRINEDKADNRLCNLYWKTKA